MGFWNDVRAIFGIEPVTLGGVQVGRHFYAIDGAGDVYRIRNPLDHPTTERRVWVPIDPSDIPPKARDVLRVLGSRYL